jgi:hypothetical protein
VRFISTFLFVDCDAKTRCRLAGAAREVKAAAEGFHRPVAKDAQEKKQSWLLLFGLGALGVPAWRGIFNLAVQLFQGLENEIISPPTLGRRWLTTAITEGTESKIAARTAIMRRAF